MRFQVQSGLPAHQYLDAPPFGARHRIKMTPVTPAVDPQGIEIPFAEPPREPMVQRSPKRKAIGTAERRQKLVPVTVEQRHVPLKRRAEARIVIFPDRDVTAIKNCEIYIRLGIY